LAGNKAWSEEDAALHAYNMQRWRNKILDEQVLSPFPHLCTLWSWSTSDMARWQIDHQMTQYRLMHALDNCDQVITPSLGAHDSF
jgi:hypothetical protein